MTNIKLYETILNYIYLISVAIAGTCFYYFRCQFNNFREYNRYIINQIIRKGDNKSWIKDRSLTIRCLFYRMCINTVQCNLNIQLCEYKHILCMKMNMNMITIFLILFFFFFEIFICFFIFISYLFSSGYYYYNFK